MPRSERLDILAADQYEQDAKNELMKEVRYKLKGEMSALIQILILLSD